MDMITKLELEDAIALTEKVRARVLEVATYLANLDLMYGSDKTKRRWQLESYHVRRPKNVPESRTDDYAHEMYLRTIAVTARLETAWDSRPKTLKFGDPNSDGDYDYDHEYDEGSRVFTTIINFPVEYLTTNGWQEEAKKRAIAIAINLTHLEIERANNAIKYNNSRNKKNKENLASAKKRLAELQELEG